MSSTKLLKAFNTFRKYHLDVDRVNVNSLNHLKRTMSNGYVCSSDASGRSEELCRDCVFNVGLYQTCGLVKIALFIGHNIFMYDPLIDEIDEIYKAMEILLEFEDG